MKTATLKCIQRATCDSFRVMNDDGKLLFATRSERTTEAHEAARMRLLAWAVDTNTRLIDSKGRIAIDPTEAGRSTPMERTRWGRA